MFQPQFASLLELFNLRRKDEIIRDVPQWTTSHGRTSVGRPARTYLQQFLTDTGCSLEALLEAMDERERERVRERERESVCVREICASSTRLYSILAKSERVSSIADQH